MAPVTFCSRLFMPYSVCKAGLAPLQLPFFLLSFFI